MLVFGLAYINIVAARIKASKKVGHLSVLKDQDFIVVFFVFILLPGAILVFLNA